MNLRLGPPDVGSDRLKSETARYLLAVIGLGTASASAPLSLRVAEI